MLEKITSRKNPVAKHASLLCSSAQARAEEKMFLAEGARLCEATLHSKTEIFRLLYTEKAYQKYASYIDKIKEKAKEIYIIDEQVASLISSTKNTQGVFCVCHIPNKSVEIKGKILVMENLQDPGNLGTILRTGEALGIDSFVLLGDSQDIYSPKVTRSTMGAVFRLNIVKYENAQILLNDLKQLNYSCFAAVVTESKPIKDVIFPEKSAVFIGNEGNGLSDFCVNNIENITIPMNGRAESLNASSAASIIMWEMVK